MKCQGCGKINPSGVKYCVECGSEIISHETRRNMEPNIEAGEGTQYVGVETGTSALFRVVNWALGGIILGICFIIVFDALNLDILPYEGDDESGALIGWLIVAALGFRYVFSQIRETSPLSEDAAYLFSLLILFPVFPVAYIIADGVFNFGSDAEWIFAWVVVFITFIIVLILLKERHPEVDFTSFLKFLARLPLLPIWIIKTIIYDIRYYVGFLRSK